MAALELALQQSANTFMAALKRTRTIAKCYPPQILNLGDYTLLYNPLEHYVESHNATSLHDICQLPAHGPMYLNRAEFTGKRRIIQSHEQLYALELATSDEVVEEALQLNEISIASNTSILSECAELGEYIIFAERDSLNFVKSEGYINPEEEKKQMFGVKTDKFLTFSKHGYDLFHLMGANDSLYTVKKYEDFNEVVRIEMGESRLILHEYSSTLDKEITNILPIDRDILCAWGKQQIVLIDHRMERQVLRMTQDGDICELKRKEGALMMAKGNDLVEIEWRSPHFKQHEVANHEEGIQDFSFSVGHCFVREKASNRVAIIEIS